MKAEIRALVFSLVFAAVFAAAAPVVLAVAVEIAPSSDGDRTVQIAAAERRNGHVGLRFDGTGALASILENATGRELVGEKCPFMDVTLGDGRIFPSTGMREAANGNLVFTFSPLQGEAEIRLVPFDGGWTIETVRFDVKDVKTWTVAHVKPGCKRWYGDMACLVSDETSGVALRAYDPLLRTACDEIPNRDPHSLYDAPDLAFYPTPEQVASGLMIRADAPDSFVGRKFGLCAGPRGKLRDMLKAMTLAAGVPWSKAGGAWALDAECNRGSYLFTTFMSEGSAKDWLDMLELGGFTAAHPYAWWVNYGLYDLNAELFPHGLDGLKEGFRVFHGAGYRVDLHHLTHCIQYIEPCFLPEVTVDPDDLIERCTYTLARPFAPGDTTMYVNEKPWDGHTVIMKSHANGNAILVNTSRGPVVDEEALADALDAGTIGGAAIDVMCAEPPDVKSRLLQHPKCIVTPHIAAFSCDFEKNFFSASVEKLREICTRSF